MNLNVYLAWQKSSSSESSLSLKFLGLRILRPWASISFLLVILPELVNVSVSRRWHSRLLERVVQKALEKLGGLESGTASFAHGHGGESVPNFTSGAGLVVGWAGEMAGRKITGTWERFLK